MRATFWAAAVAALVATGPAGAAVPDGEAALTLRGALGYSLKSGEAVRCDLVVTFGREDGVWQSDAYATADGYNHGLHLATAAVRESDDALAIDLDVVFVRAGGSGWGDATGPEGRADFEVHLQTDGAHWAGTYSGRFQETDRGRPTDGGLAYETSGPATLRMGPAWPPAVKGHKPLAPGEHPRLFFRSSDLPALRKRAETEVGAKFVARVRDLLSRNRNGFGWNRDGSRGLPYTEGTHAAGHAFLYALTGDAAEAERARWLAFCAMASNGGEWGSWGNSLRIPGVAAAYDLCYDAWKKSDPDFLQEVATWLEAAGVGRGDNPDLHFPGTFHAAGGLAALAVLGDPCPEPKAPVAPDAAPLLPAPKGFTPGDGVPVSPFTDGRVADEWLLAGGFSPGYGGEPLAALGGPAAARPGLGETFRQGDAEFEWRLRKTGGPRIGLYKFEVQPAAKGESPPWCADGGKPVLAYLYAVLDNDAARAVEAMPRAWGHWHGPDMPIPGVRLWVGGRELTNGDVVRLEAGKYPVMMELAFANQMLIEPRLVEVTDEVHAQDRAEYERARAGWQAVGEAYPHAAARARRMARFVGRYVDFCYGDKGFVTEDSTQADAIYNLLPYLEALRNVTGRDLAAAHPRVREILPLILLTHRRFLRHDWGTGHFRVLGFPSLTDDGWRALVRREMDDSLADVDATGSGPAYLSLPWDGMFALLNYPWDVQSTGRADAGLPCVVEDKRFGGYVLTRAPGGGRELQAIVLLQQGAPRSSITAGDFAVLVDGRRWTGYANAGGGFFRPPCLTRHEVPNVVRVQGAVPTRGARLLGFDRLGDDGSAVITMVQDWWVDGTAEDGFSAPKISDPANLGVTAVRSVLVDYSGTCGTPMLVAVADRVEAPADRAVWLQMNLPDTAGHNNEGRLDVQGHTFLMRDSGKRGDEAGCTMAGTLLGAAKLVVEYRSDAIEIADSDRLPPHFREALERRLPQPLDNVDLPAARSGRHPDSPEDVLRDLEEHESAVSEESPEKAENARPVSWFYLTVLTLQQGEPPAVEVEGSGRDTLLTIGRRVVRFEGDRIVLDR